VDTLAQNGDATISCIPWTSGPWGSHLHLWRICEKCIPQVSSVGLFVIKENCVSVKKFFKCRTTHKLNLSTGLWSRVANLLLPRCYVSAAVLQGKIYAMGGFDGSSRTKTVERFDPEGNKWEAVQSMEIIRQEEAS